GLRWLASPIPVTESPTAATVPFLKNDLLFIQLNLTHK
ncbi:MAG: hypothetical protein ACI9RP_001054, partial [Cyclobacteriaceae bacterium]